MSKLTALQVESISKPGRYSDGNGLYLEVDKAGNKRWLFRYQFNKKRTHLGLDSYDKKSNSLAQARKKAEIAALKWSYSPIISIEREEYSRYAKVGFDLSDYSDFWKVQFVDIKERDRIKIVKLKKEKSWRELKDFAEGKQEESPVFTFELAIAQQKLGEGTQALASLERFLERGRNKYVHYGALAASMVIDTRYAQEDDAAVVAAGGHYNLMSYYLNGKQFSKYKAGLSLMRLASSLTFVKPQQLGRALQLFNDLKDNIELVEDSGQRADLELQVDAQLDNLKAQIGQIGARAKAKT